MLKKIEQIQPVDKVVGNEVSAYLDTLTKPQGSLGRLEELAIQLSEITSEQFPVVSPPGIIVFAADHGIAKEGVSAYPQEVTVQMVQNFLNGGAAINQLAEHIGALFEIVDIGVANHIDDKALISKKIRSGTGNFLHEDAMSKEEALAAIEIGIEVAEKVIRAGAKCLILGEMGIGNTTSSSAILATLSETDIESIVGVGTGISAQQREYKSKIIKQAIANREPNREDILDILAKLGGLEIAGMTGAILGAAANKIPILIDGFICSVSALIAVNLSEHVRDYLIIGHKSNEVGHKVAIEMLGKSPILDLNLRLGEGTGAALAFPILEASTKILKGMATFTTARVSQKS